MGNNVIEINDYLMLKDNKKGLRELALLSYRELLSSYKGINLLEPMSSIITEKIIGILEDFSDVSVFTINYNDTVRIVLRYVNPNYQDIDIEFLERNGEIAYKSNNYNDCRNNYLKILQGPNDPKPHVYYRLGLVSHNNTSATLDYLKIAVGLSSGIVRDNYLNELNEYISEIRKNNPYTFIENLDFIMDFINESDLDVESTCQNLNLSREQTDIIKLRIAECFFIQGDINKGKEFIKSVEVSSEKTDSTKRLLNIINRNIRVYPYRKNDNTRTFSLKLKPGKPINKIRKC